MFFLHYLFFFFKFEIALLWNILILGNSSGKIFPIQVHLGKFDRKSSFLNSPFTRDQSWVHGLMAINVECEFRDRGSIPSVCKITDADLGQNCGLLLD